MGFLQVISSLSKRPQNILLCLLPCEDTEKIQLPRKQALTRPQLCHALIFDFPVSRTLSIKCLLFTSHCFKVFLLQQPPKTKTQTEYVCSLFLLICGQLLFARDYHVKFPKTEISEQFHFHNFKRKAIFNFKGIIPLSFKITSPPNSFTVTMLQEYASYSITDDFYTTKL